MKIVKKTIALLATGLFLLLSPAQAQTAGTGTIEGRVLNTNNGQYLRNALVTVQGTKLQSTTNDFGEYRIYDVPSGAATVQAVYVGLPTVTQSVAVGSGKSVTLDFDVGDQARPTRDGEVVQLDKFVVTSSRETDATNIATNEQRASANIKNVYAAGAFGDAAEGNVGEMMKFIPGVTIEYVAVDARAINLRGIGSNFTGVTSDGARLASAASAVASRTFELEQVSLNNISRVEVTKLPTPDMPADSLGGSVNLVSKSAFESKWTVFKYRAYLALNSNDGQLFEKTGGPRNYDTYKAMPSADFSYLAPLTKNFGISISGLVSNMFDSEREQTSSWRFAGGGATTASPYLQSISETPGPKVTNRDSFSMQADWRPASGHLISAGVQANYYHAFFDNQITNYSVGSAAPLSYAPDFVDGANGGQITQERFAFDKIGAMVAGRISHRFINRTWEIDSGLSGSRSRSAYRDSSGGHFFDAQTKLLNVSRVRFDGIVNSLPAKITPVDSAGNAINYVDLNNYLLTQVSTGPRDGSEELLTARLNVKRNLDFLPFRATVKIGGLMSEQKRILDRSGSTMTFLGPDGIANTADDNASLYRAPNSIGTANVFSGRPSPQYVDLFRLWQLYKDRPAYFSNTLSQQVSTLNTAYSNAKTIKEVITAGYVQLEAKFWQDRMRVVTGVRYEKTQDLGRGPQRDDSAVFQRDAAGKFATDSNGAKIRKPEAGAPGSLEEFALTRNTRGAKTDRSYDGYNPSVHFTFNITKDIILRAAYASTFGRPDFGNIIPGVTLNENQSANPPPGATPGSITVINSGLKPFTAKNYDLSLEYYFPKGGLVTVGVFRKDLTDFFASSTVLATPEILASLDLDPKYVGWDVTTRYNVAEAAQITGIEFNYDQTLAFLPGWGKYFKFNANYTKLRLLGARQTDFSSFIPVAGNLGLSFSNKKLLVMVNENYRGRQTRGTSGITPNAFQYYAPRGTLDINVDYKVFKKLTLFANVRNATNKAFVREIYSADSPFYTHQQLRQNYGSLWTFGVKGSF